MSEHENAGLSAAMQPIRHLVEEIVKELVDIPDRVSIGQMVSEGGTVVMTVRTANGETGKVIGKAGRNAEAIRTLLDSFAAKHKCQIILEIDDPRRRKRERSQSNAKR